ncbi:MAG: cohesin domain-containing protein [Patescibacteria group bacterium]|jgi:hypothetical protein
MEEKGTLSHLTRFLIWSAALLFGWSVFGVSTAFAATLYFAPAQGTYDSGSSFSVGVYVSSADQAMNAVSSSISFPTSLLQVTGISKNGSIMNLWAQEPSYSNTAGTISFEGIVLNPGYIGTSGKVATITFKGTGNGAAIVSFAGGSVLANDGLGTNILTSFGSGTYTIKTAGATPVTQPTTPVITKPSTTVKTPNAPTVTSTTHADPVKWYASRDVKLDWTLPTGITDVSVVFDHAPTADPSVSSKGVVSSITTTLPDDGIWFAHVKLKNRYGWGAVAHFEVNADTTGPENLEILKVSQDEKGMPTFSILVSDAGCGVATYELGIDTGALTSWVPDDAHLYKAPLLSPGDHLLTVNVVDHLGNASSFPVRFIVSNIAPPIFSDYPDKVKSGESIALGGSSLPDTWVKVLYKRADDARVETTVITNANGEFTFSLPAPVNGTYTFWAQVVGPGNATSEETARITIAVGLEQMELIIQIGFGLLILLLLLILIFLIRVVCRRCKPGVCAPGMQGYLPQSEVALRNALAILQQESAISGQNASQDLARLESLVATEWQKIQRNVQGK